VRETVQRLGIGSRRIEVIHNGIDTERFRCNIPPEARPPNIVMAARFARNKDHATLIRSARLLADRGWTGRLLLAGGGKGSHRSRCERLATDLGIEGRVDFLGSVDNLPALFAGARVAVLSSRKEGFGLVLVEAMAAGCAIAATRIPGIVEVVREGENGWLFPFGDASATAEVLEKALTPDDEARRRIEVGRRDAGSAFTIEAMARRYRSLLDSLVQGS
jgi:glycosyltransferase involved in cell wall biosynthesis